MASRSFFFVLLVLFIESQGALATERVWRRLGDDLTEAWGIGAHHERFIIDSEGHVLAGFLHGSKSYLAVPMAAGWRSLELPFSSHVYDAELAKDGSIKALGRDGKTGTVWLGHYDPIDKRWTILVKTTDKLTPARDPDTVIGKIVPGGSDFFVLYPLNAGKDEWAVVKGQDGRLVAQGSPLRIGLSENVQLLLNRKGNPLVFWADLSVVRAAELSGSDWGRWESPSTDRSYRAYSRALPSGQLQVAYFHDDGNRDAQVLSLFEGKTVADLKRVWSSPPLKSGNSFAEVFASPEGGFFVIPCRSSLSRPDDPLRLYSVIRGGKWQELPTLPFKDCTHRATLASRNGEPILLFNDNSRLAVMALQAPLAIAASEKAPLAKVYFVSPIKHKQVKVHFAELLGKPSVDPDGVSQLLQVLGSDGIATGKFVRVESVVEEGIKLWYGIYGLDRAISEPAAAILPIGQATKLKHLKLEFQPVEERTKASTLRKLISGLSKVGNENEGRRAPYSIGKDDGGAEILLDRDGKPKCKLASCSVQRAGDIYRVSWEGGGYNTDFIFRNAVSGIFESPASFDYAFEMGGKPAFVFTGCLPGEGCRIALWYESNGKIEKAIAGGNIVIP